MVDPIRVLLAFSLGLMLWIALPVIANALPARYRNSVGTYYAKLGVKVYHQLAFVRRIATGYDIKQITVDNEQKLLKTTLSSSILGDDEEYRFKDPDDRIKRLWNKPVSVNYEEIAGTVDPELCELASAYEEHATENGTVEGEKVKPYVAMDDTMQVVDPKDVQALVGKDTPPETIKTVESFTRERLRKYGHGVGIRQAARIIGGFVMGSLVVYGGFYIKNEIVGGGSGGGIDNPIGGGIIQLTDPQYVTDLLVVAL